MKNLSQKSKVILYAIAAIVAVVIIYFIVKLIIKQLDKSDPYSRKSRDEFRNSNLSFTDLEFENMSLNLLDAMSGPEYSISKITAILRSLRTSDDWYKLVNTFGVRETTAWYSSWSGNLAEWLIDELREADEQIVREILAGINVTF